MIDINSISNYLLINNDCFSVLKDIPDHSIDLILTDPPYNIAKYSTGNIKFNWRREINNDLAEWDLAKLDPFDLVAEFKRILKPNGNIFVFVLIILSVNIIKLLTLNLIHSSLWFGIKQILCRISENHLFLTVVNLL